MQRYISVIHIVDGSEAEMKTQMDLFASSFPKKDP